MNELTTNGSAAYTPLESLLLFQALLTQGVDAPAFARVSELLKNNPLVKASHTYSPARLSADALQHLFLEVWQQELKTEIERNINNDASLSPDTRKRKLESPPLPTLRDTHEHINKLPGLLERLYTNYQAQVVAELKHEEKQFGDCTHAINIIVNEQSKRARKAAEEQHAIASNAQGESKTAAATVASGNANATASTQHSPVPIAAAPTKRPTSTTPVFPPKPGTVHAVPLTHLPPGTQGTRHSHSPQPPPGSNASLQQPHRASQSPAQTLQTPAQPPRPSISPRPDVANKGQAGASPSPYSRPVQTPAGHAQQQFQPPPQPRLQPTPSPGQAQSQARLPQKSPLVQPQHAGQVPPTLQAAPPRPTGGPPPAQQIRPTSTTPVLPPTRPIQPQPGQATVPRPIAASPTPPPASGSVGPVPPQQWQSGQQQPHFQLAHPHSAAASPSTSGTPRPYVAQPPRPAIPEHMIRHAATPNSARRTSAGPAATAAMAAATAAAATMPTTPRVRSPSSVTRGFGTKWAPQSTPSTPGPSVMEPESPAFEPVSPPVRKSMLPTKEPMKLTLPHDIAGKVNKARNMRPAPRGRVSSTLHRRSQSVASHADDISVDHSEADRPIKDEDLTPRPREETGDTTADESVQGQRLSVMTPSSISSRLSKRKRQETPPEPPTKQTHVMWTRGFTKVSSSVLDRISSHRDANMFAKPLGERDAPNYKGIVLQPQDFASIRAAIKNGNKAAVQAASQLPNGDPGTPNVWLPISEDLLPPRAIINSAQLDRELVHMFCNAIMYNPDPDRGPGPSFLKRSDDENEEIVGYQLDENGIVRNTRSMFIEVEKLLGELRSAEKGRNAPPPSSMHHDHHHRHHHHHPGGSSSAMGTRPGSVAAGTPADDTADDEDELAADTEVTSGSAVKRRRVSARG